MVNNIFLLDATGFLFRAYFALPEMTDIKGRPVQAVYGFIRSINKLIKDFSPQHIVAVFDGPDNKKSRTDMYADYKANRTKQYPDLPFQIEVAQEFCRLSSIPVVISQGVEADDVLGTICNIAKKASMEVYICTADKDMCQLVEEGVFIVNPWKENRILDTSSVKDSYGVPPALIPDYLALVGDSSDNIPGVPGIGPKTAAELLVNSGSLDLLMSNLDKVKGDKKRQILKDHESTLLLSRRLAVIDRNLPIDILLKEYEFRPPSGDNKEFQEFYRKYGFISFLKELMKSDKSSSELLQSSDGYCAVKERQDFELILKRLKIIAEIAVAFEETELPKKNLAFAIAIAPGEAFYFSHELLESESDLSTELYSLLQNSLKISFYNTKDEWRFCKQEVFPTHFYDIMLAAYLVDSVSKQRSLEDLALHHLGIALSSSSKKIDKGIIDSPEQICFFCCQRADVVLQLKNIIAKSVEEAGCTDLLEKLEFPLVPVLFDMERTGVFLDLEELQVTGKRITETLHSLEAEIYTLVGEEFNIKSSKQLSHVLFEKLGLPDYKKGSTSAPVLEELQQLHPVIPLLLSFRSLEKLRSSYVDSLPKQIDEETGCIHPSFSQAVTATGRLACQKPNLQNIPLHSIEGKAIRKAFKPRNSERIFVSADYSQIELRMLAHFSEDPVLIESFSKDKDIHTETAARTFGVSPEEVTKDMRHKAKAINFGIIYGQQAYGLSQQLGVSVQQAGEMIKNYFDCFPGVTKFIEQCVAKARQNSSVTTLWGRRRVITGFDSSKSFERALAERLAVNTVLQGTAADLIKFAMIDIQKIINKKFLESKLILQIHDELIFETTPMVKEALISEVKEVMETVKVFKVPLTVNTAVGKNWAEC